jgi:hypothetical protein
MELRAICSLRYIKIDPQIAGYNFRDNYLLYSGDSLDGQIFTNFLVSEAGAIHMREFLNYSFMLSLFEIEEEAQMLTAIQRSYTSFNHFTSFLWFSKDNSVNVGTMLGLLPKNLGGQERAIIRKKIDGYSNASGKFEEIEITKEDLDTASKFYERIAELQIDSNDYSPKIEYDERGVISDTSFHFKRYGNNSRIDRAVAFLVMARSNSFLPLKISLYVAILECLFTTDKTEVVHKVCERVALYIGGNLDERLNIYEQVKKTYDIRSSFFHGQTIGKKQDVREKLEQTSIEIDGLLRRILTKVIFDDSDTFLNDENLPKYFNRLVLNK